MGVEKLFFVAPATKQFTDSEVTRQREAVPFRVYRRFPSCRHPSVEVFEGYTPRSSKDSRRINDPGVCLPWSR